MKIAMPALIVLLMAVGCGDGRNECEIGEQHLRACLNSSDDLRPPPSIPVCEGTQLCVARCFNGASCEVIRDRFDGMPTDLSRLFSVCLDICEMGP